MRVIPHDTTAEAYRVQMDILRGLTPEQRLDQAMRLSDTVVRLCEASIRAHHPIYSEREVFLARVRLMLGDRLFAAAYPDEPKLQP